MCACNFVYQCACDGDCGHTLELIGLCSWCQQEGHVLMKDLGKVKFLGMGHAAPDQEAGH